MCEAQRLPRVEMPAVDASRRMPAADAPVTYPHTLTCHPTGTPKAPVHPAAAGDRPCCSSNKRSLTASPWASAAGRGQPWNGVLSGEDRRARALLVRSTCVAPFRARQRTGGRAEAAPAAPPARLPLLQPRAAARAAVADDRATIKSSAFLRSWAGLTPRKTGEPVAHLSGRAPRRACPNRSPRTRPPE